MLDWMDIKTKVKPSYDLMSVGRPSLFLIVYACHHPHDLTKDKKMMKTR